MKCLVDDASTAKNDRNIPYDNVSFGSYLDVEDGMTLLIGTHEGGSDLGRIRIVSANSTRFLVSENANIKWQNNLHLTVIRYWDLWPVFPRIIQDPSNEEDVIFYKDYNIAYSNQNFTLGTFVNAGPHRPVLIENGTGTVYYSSTGTLNLLNHNLGYNWTFEGGNPTGSTSAHPGNVYYTTPGDYVTRLIVTDNANGVQDTTYRYISVKNKIGEGGTTPIVRWEMNTLSGSRDEAGYGVEFKVYDEVQIDENSLIMLHATDWYGNTKTSLGGNYPNSSNIFFVGYIERGSIHYNAQYNYISFSAVSVTGIMKKMTGFSVSVESKQNPATWFELRDMDIRRAIYHYLRWHSTVLSVTDFSFVGDDRKIQFFDVDRTSVFDAVDNLMKSALFGRLSSDRQGRLWADVDPLAYDNPTGTFVGVMDITKRDWMSEPQLEENIYDSTSYVELGGIAYSGAVTGTFSALLSGAPGYTPSFHGSIEKIQGLALTGQTQLNQLSGNIWANRTQKFPSISMEMATPIRNLDIAPQEVVSIKIQEDDTIRNEQIEGIYIPASFEWSYNPKNQILLPKVDYLGLVSGDPGDTILIPETADDGEFNFPEFSFPPFPPFVLPGLEIINPLAIKNVVIHVKDHGIFYTNNFDSSSPSWQNANVNLALFPSIMRNFEVALNGSMAIQLANDSVWTTPSPGSGWKKIFDTSYIQNFESLAFPRGYEVAGFGINRQDGSILILGSLVATILSTNAVYSWKGDMSGVSVASTVNLIPSYDSSASQRYFYLTFGDNEWLATYDKGNNTTASIILTDSGQSASNQSDIPTAINTDSIAHMRSTQAKLHAVAKAGGGVITSDGGESWDRITGSPTPYRENLYVDRFESIITNTDGTQIVIASSSMGLSYSITNGVSWVTGTFGSSNATCVWHVGDSAYLFGANNNIYMVENLLLSTGSILKTGNLANLITGSFTVIAMRHY